MLFGGWTGGYGGLWLDDGGVVVGAGTLKPPLATGRPRAKRLAWRKGCLWCKGGGRRSLSEDFHMLERKPKILKGQSSVSFADSSFGKGA